MNKPIFTTHEIAHLLSVDTSTVIDWIDRNRLPAFRTPGGHRRVRRGDLLSFLKAYNMPVAGPLARDRPVILVVEDDKDFREAIRRLIEARHRDVLIQEAEDGFLAGKWVKELRPDVVVLDLFLPGVDGFKVCEHIRRDPDLAHTRVVAMSGLDTPENRRKILDAGADVFISKPLGLPQLGDVLDNLLAGAVPGR